MHSLCRINYSLRNHVALHDSAKNIYQNRLHLLVRDQNLESFRHLLFRGTTTNVEKGKKLLQKSTVALITADDLADAAEKVVTAAARTRS